MLLTSMLPTDDLATIVRTIKQTKLQIVHGLYISYTPSAKLSQKMQ